MDSPPTSTIAAPASNMPRAASTARSRSKWTPPSEKESGVTLTTPMTIGPAERSRRPPWARASRDGLRASALEGRLGAGPEARGKGLQALRAAGAGEDDRPGARLAEADDVDREVRRGEGRRTEAVPGRDFAQRVGVARGDDQIGVHAASLTRGNGRFVDVLGVENRLRISVQGQRDHGAADGHRRRDPAGRYAPQQRQDRAEDRVGPSVRRGLRPHALERQDAVRDAACTPP